MKSPAPPTQRPADSQPAPARTAPASGPLPDPSPQVLRISLLWREGGTAPDDQNASPFTAPPPFFCRQNVPGRRPTAVSSIRGWRFGLHALFYSVGKVRNLG